MDLHLQNIKNLIHILYFFHFEKMKCIPLSVEYRYFISETMLYSFNDCKSRFEKIQIYPNSFIVPAGLYRQFMCTICKPDKLLGFLDNDKTKQNHRVYGTNFLVYSFDKLKEINHKVYIYLYAGPYVAAI